MDIYILDGNLEVLGLIENYHSFIWTERYSSYGDFEIKLDPESSYTGMLRLGRYVHIKESRLLMRIMRFKKSTVSDHLLTVTGRTMESWLIDRVVVPNTDEGLYVQSGYTSEIVATLVNDICVFGTGLTQRDIIPNLDAGWYRELGASITLETRPRNLYDLVKELCDNSDLGFRILYDHDAGKFQFDVHQGTDRSSDMVFSPKNENISNVSFLKSNEDFKNTAYVYHRDLPGIEIVYRRGFDYTTGTNRRVLEVDASSIEDPRPWKLRRAGLDALAEHNEINIVDGELLYHDMRYNGNYTMGDLVMVDDSSGNTSKTRITEYMWSFDGEGFKEHPSFTTLED